MSLVLPKRAGGARVLERLGEGGMAVVHRAEDPFRPGRGLAVKFLKAEASGDSDLVVRFLREGEVLKRLSHPNLVEVFDFGRAG
ncbi:MAG: protein kinase, partial [Holophaga sp.]|nr:protein kinase [Holophaga sp.]